MPFCTEAAVFWFMLIESQLQGSFSVEKRRSHSAPRLLAGLCRRLYKGYLEQH